MKNIMIWIMLLLSITYTDAQNGKSPRKDYAKLANYDESKVPQYTLPSVLMCHDGDTLWNIAKHYGTTIEKMKQYNENLTEPLETGQKLFLLKEMESLIGE